MKLNYLLHKAYKVELNFSNFFVIKAHDGSIRGVAVDALNQLTITAGSEGLIKFWKFKSTNLVHSINLPSSPNQILLHRDR